MATPEAYREFYRRQHRVLGAYLALHCWHTKCDAVIVPRPILASIHQMRKFTEEHLSWLQEDIKPYFPESNKLYYSKGAKLFAAVALSRLPFPAGFGVESLGDEERAKQWRAKNFMVAALSELPIGSEAATERSVSTFLTLMSVGLVVPEGRIPENRTPVPRIRFKRVAT